MSVTAPARKRFRFPADAGNITAIMTWVTDVTTAANAGTLTANALSADETGRAVMATGFFNEATATAKFAAGAIVGTLLKAGALAADATGRALMATGYFTEAKATDAFAAGAITTGLLKANAVTGPKVDSSAFLGTVVTGRNGAGACTLTGAKVGDKVIANINLTDAATGRTSFETTITVADQIQQTSASDLSTKKYEVILLVQS